MRPPSAEPRTGGAAPVEGRTAASAPVPETIVRVTIDRLEVRAAPPAAAPVATRRTVRQPALSLDDYLRRRT
ncbi:hypothetical protein OH807_36525 [Kitasatospora sp. NBC_01560]|uniref:hypothetical protein n=1 Tax=Kitasatospora sp. NBC_01560 TaxID=2975965 RepID=UPI003867C52E